MASSSLMVLYLAPTSGSAACYSVANPTVQQFHSVHSKVSTHHQSPIVATYHDIAVIFEKKNLKQLEQKKIELHLKLLENIFCEIFHGTGGGCRYLVLDMIPSTIICATWMPCGWYSRARLCASALNANFPQAAFSKAPQ